MQLLWQNRANIGSTARLWRVNTAAQLLHTFTRLDSTLRSQRRRRRMLLFVRGDFLLMLQCQTNIIQSIQQAVPYKFVDRERGAESKIIPNLTLLEIDREFIIVDFLGPLHDSPNFVLRQPDGQESVLGRVVRKDVGERR